MVNYCFFLPSDKNTPIKEAGSVWKEHQGHFIGIGYVFPREVESPLKAICEKTGLVLHKLSLGALDFHEYVASYKLDFLYQLKSEKQSQLAFLKARSSGTATEISPEILQLEAELNELDLSIQRKERASLAKAAAASASPFESLLETPTEKTISEEIRNISPGVFTGFSIGTLPLKLDGGEISVVAAPTGHGKTSLVINLLMSVLEHNPLSSVFLFSYEEARAPVFCLALNRYVGERLSDNNRESIRSYFRDGSPQYVSEKHRRLFLEKKDAFFSELVETRRLNILYSSYSAEELCLAIRFLSAQPRRPTAIFIDYMQLLRLGTAHKNQSRQEELKQICLLLKDCAVDTGLPILIAAQFNRTVQNETDLSAQAIGEAGDIERIAALILGAWNRKFAQQPPEDTLFLKVLKGRNIPVGSSDVLRFEGNECKISNLGQTPVRSKLKTGF